MSEPRDDYNLRTGDYFGDAAGPDETLGTTGSDDAEADAAAEAIVADIEVTRDEMSGTIEAIGARLEPQALVGSAKQTVRDATIGRVENMVQDVSQTAQEATGGIVDTIRQNPIPAAMTGIGLFLLWQSANKSGGRTRYTYRGYSGAYGAEQGGEYYGEERRRGGGFQETAGNVVGTAQERASSAVGTAQRTASDVVGSAQQTASDVVGTAQQTASDVVGTAQQTASDVVGTAQRRASDVVSTAQQAAARAPGEIQRLVNENPLGAGLVAAAVGAAAALAVPTTRKEQELYGRPRDAAIEKAQEQIEGVLDRVEESTSGDAGTSSGTTS